MAILSNEVSNTLYDHLVYVFQYKPGQKMKLRSTHIKTLSRGLELSSAQLIGALGLCDWCTVEKRVHIFKWAYYIQIGNC